ncbi:uncharacterized protein H6S33_007324 [Morchella sextelata]|uniref:uncharacterized protein n=1 Tax=Morchella sextelata TaxID=1174677 RepID=UPI001D03DBB2|nr:uncharacterized protein H6S33_007324 [Morchella sextelata]KAH0603665.1 hypothetical protein H6S33_007324 [Morchella sextelata]
MAAYSAKLEFAKLTERNFSEWKSHIRTELSMNGVWGICTGEYTFAMFFEERMHFVPAFIVEDHRYNPIFINIHKRDWERMCAIATGAILSSMEDHLFLRYEKYEDPALLWQALLDGHQASFYSSDDYLYSELLDNTRLLEGEPVASYINRVNHLLGQLHEKAAAAEGLSLMMAGLPDDWQMVKDNIMAHESPSIDSVISQLEEFQHHCQRWNAQQARISSGAPRGGRRNQRGRRR